MKIISPFKDFYDFPTAFAGASTEPLFIRETKTSEWPKLSDYRNWKLLPHIPDSPERGCCEIEYIQNNRLLEASLTQCLLGVCGKIYEVVEFYPYGENLPCSLIFSPEDLLQYQNLVPSSYTYSFTNLFFRQDKTKRFDKRDKWFQVRQDDDPFLSLNAPFFLAILSGPNWKLQTNPNLIQYSLQKKFDPMQIYQEIEMYIGGVLVQRDKAPLTTGNDKVIAAQKGFDPVISFRGPKEFKDVRRKRNKERKRNKNT
jgi:hypothetical protein